MKLRVDSISEAFNVEIDMTEQEKSNFLDDGIVDFSLCLARLVGELIQDSCETVEQAKMLASLLIDIERDVVNSYIDEVFENIRASREEAKLYGYMEDTFDAFLESCELSRGDFVKKYGGSKTLCFEPALNDDKVSVILTNGFVGDILTEIPISMLDEDDESRRRLLCAAFITAIVAGDLIFGEPGNPIRAIDAGPECDGGLSAAIGELLA